MAGGDGDRFPESLAKSGERCGREEGKLVFGDGDRSALLRVRDFPTRDGSRIVAAAAPSTPD